MKLLNSLVGTIVIGAVSLFAAGVTWWIVGPPNRSVPCDPESLDSGHVCLETVQSWGEDACLWIDARPRALWEKNGVPGSVLLTDDNQEDYFELEEEFMSALFNGGEIYPHVVIYCNEAGCGSSKAIAKNLREGSASQFGFEVHVLHGGWKALASEGMTRN